MKSDLARNRGTSNWVTIAQLLRQGATNLTNISDSPILDAEVLLSFTLDLNRTQLLQHGSDLADNGVVQFFLRLIAARCRGIPVAYIVGRQAFMDFDLVVSPHTLIPRPFTETLVEAMLAELGDRPHVISDIGTGSGAIALAIARRTSSSRIIATDVSVPALRIAAANARRHNLLRRIDFRAGSLLNPLRIDDYVTAVIANLPYLPAVAMSEPTIQHEPRSALDGGTDGLALIEGLLSQINFFPTIHLIALELLPNQVDTVAYLLRQKKFRAVPVTDGQSSRGLIGRK